MARATATRETAPLKKYVAKKGTNVITYSQKGEDDFLSGLSVTFFALFSQKCSAKHCQGHVSLRFFPFLTLFSFYSRAELSNFGFLLFTNQDRNMFKH